MVGAGRRDASEEASAAVLAGSVRGLDPVVVR